MRFYLIINKEINLSKIFVGIIVKNTLVTLKYKAMLQWDIKSNIFMIYISYVKIIKIDDYYVY